MREIVLKAPATGIYGGKESATEYRWVLMPDGYSDTVGGERPILCVEQLLRSGEWWSTGGQWFLETLSREKWDPSSRICISGGPQWYATGIFEAVNEAKSLMATLDRERKIVA